MGQVWRFLQVYRWMKLEPDLTWWQASDKATDLSMSGTMQFKVKCLLPSTHQKLQVSCTEIHSGFFWRMRSLSTKPINDSNIDLEKFPASKVMQLAKKMESSKSTARHIKAVASDPQVPQVNLIRHQRTDLQPSKSEWKQHSHKQRSKSQKRYSNEHKNQRPPFKKFDPSQAHKRRDRCSKCGDSKHVEVSCQEVTVQDFNK